MLQGINIFDFYVGVELRRWNNADIKEYCVIFANIALPPFVTVSQTISTQATVKLINESSGLAEYTKTVALSDSNVSGFKNLVFNDSTPINVACGYYSYEVTIGVSKYYSEVFGMTDDFTNLVKFEVSSENVTLSGIYELPLTGINNVFYLYCNGVSITAEVQEEGVEKPYGDIPIFSTLNIIRTISVNGTNQIFRYISLLRILSVNGSVYVTVNNEKKAIYDTSCEVDNDNSFGVYMQLNFIYKETDFVSVRNEI